MECTYQHSDQKKKVGILYTCLSIPLSMFTYTHTGEYNCINLYVGGCPHTDRTYTSPQLPGGCAVSSSMRSVAYKSGKKDKLEECPPSHWHWCTLCWAPGSHSVTAATAPALSLAPSSDQHPQSAGRNPKPPYFSPRERRIWLDKIIPSQHYLFTPSPAHNTTLMTAGRPHLHDH